MNTTENFIPIEEAITSFEIYFQNNNRCILSAPFGEGKSYFLSRFIKEKATKYHFITLHPTNYQVCDNQDVFEYIKRDILLGLLTISPESLTSHGKSRIEIAWQALVQSKSELLACLPDINIGIASNGITLSLSRVCSAISSIFQKHKELESINGNYIVEYFDNLEKTGKDIYEFNPISNLISNLIMEIKQQDTKIALVIEDLDRIDPAQIFRILNIFSAHFTQANGYDDGITNKFGFDKILILCDFNNIEKIYHHLYGCDTDFNGYISKFCSNGIFDYSLRNRLKDYLLTLFEDDLRKEYPVTAELLTEHILDGSLKGNDIIMNLRTIKTRFLNAKNQIISENFYFMPGSNSGAYIKTENIDLIKLLAISAVFKIELTQIISNNYDDDDRHTYNELYKLCWPFIIIKDYKPAEIRAVNPHRKDSAYCLNTHSDIVVEYTDNEVTHVTFYCSSCISFNSNLLTKVYDFIEQCKKFIG